MLLLRSDSTQLYRTPYRISALLCIQTLILSRQVITVHHVAKSVLQSVLEGGGHWFDSQIECFLSIWNRDRGCHQNVQHCHCKMETWRDQILVNPTKMSPPAKKKTVNCVIVPYRSCEGIMYTTYTFGVDNKRLLFLFKKRKRRAPPDNIIGKKVPDMPDNLFLNGHMPEFPGKSPFILPINCLMHPLHAS